MLMLSLAIPVMKDFTLIYCVCVLFGMCYGMVMTSEYIIYVEVFGHLKFPQAYGFLHLFKFLVTVFIGLSIANPTAVYLYPVHPLDVSQYPKNFTQVCDELGKELDHNYSNFLSNG